MKKNILKRFNYLMLKYKVFANSNFLILIYLKPDGVKL